MKELIVNLDHRSYPIYIGEPLLPKLAPLLKKHGISPASSIMVVSDEKVAQHYLTSVMEGLQAEGFRAYSFTIPNGETSKSFDMYHQVITSAIENGLDRKSVVIALGGGVVGDLSGFVAATYMRGIRFVQIPTTILAHDSSVGGKVGINHRLAKNMIGAFHQPEFVLYDTSTLQSLPEREIKSGLAEMIKHGLIWDSKFVEWCSDHADELIALEPEAMAYGLYKGCEVKSYVVSQDEKESGMRAILNLGHTIGHALEAVAGYNELLHGEAISIGMVGSARLAHRLGYSMSIYERTKSLLTSFGLPVAIPQHMDTEQIMQAMMRDKKFKEGQMIFVIPVEIGKVEIRSGISYDMVKEVVEELKREE